MFNKIKSLKDLLWIGSVDQYLELLRGVSKPSGEGLSILQRQNHTELKNPY